MNTSILVDSFGYLQTKTTTSIILLAKWIYEEFSIINYNDDKLLKSINNIDIDVFKSISHFNINVDLDCLLKNITIHSNSNDFEISQRIDLLSQAGAKMNHRLLIYASNYNCPKITKVLIKHNVDIHFKNDICLRRFSIVHNNPEIVKLLLESGADVHAKYDESLIRSCCSDRLEVIKLLLQYGANVRTNNNEALRNACWFGNPEIIEVLIDAGANVNAIIYNSNIPANNTKVIKTLIKLGAAKNHHLNTDTISKVMRLL